MIKKTLKSLKRAPVRAVAVLLFAAVITMIISALQASNDEEMRHYEEAYQAVPVKFSITHPYYKGEALDLGSNLPMWALDLFTDKNDVDVV